MPIPGVNGQPSQTAPDFVKETTKKFLFPDWRARLGGWDVGIALMVFLAGFLLFSRHNDFPAHYHPDEPGKVRQVKQGSFNFNHPLLLLQATKLILGPNAAEENQNTIVRAGRTASAIFSAAAAACLVLAAAQLAGPVAAAAAGALLLTSHQLYELAHYMKEDAALAFGICATVLAYVRCARLPGGWAFAMLGASSALAVSGKYVGALVLVFPLALAISQPPGQRLRAGVIAGLGFAAVLIAINFPMLGALKEFSTNLGREVGFVVGGHKGLTRSVPHGVYGAVFRHATNPVLWVLIGLFYAGLIASFLPRLRETLRLRAVEWTVVLLGAFPVVYTLILSFSPKTHHRYFLPVTCLLLLLAALAPFQFRTRWAIPAGAALFLAALGFSISQTLVYDRGFQNDARLRLVEYVTRELPGDAVIVQDKRVGLPVEGDSRFEGSGMEIPQRVDDQFFAADAGTLAEMQRKGIRYVAVSQGDYGRFFLKTHKPRAGETDDFERRKKFYEELFSVGTLIWESPSGQLQYLQPAIKLYRLPEGEAP